MTGLRKFEDFKEYRDLIEEFMDARVFNIYYNELSNSFYTQEMCDQYFSKDLNAEDCDQLSEMFAKLSIKIKEFEESPPMEHYLAVEKDEEKKAEKAKELEEKRKKVDEEIREKEKKEKSAFEDIMDLDINGEQYAVKLSSIKVLSQDVATLDIIDLDAVKDAEYDTLKCRAFSYDKESKDVLEDIEVTFNNVEIKDNKMSFRPDDMHVLYITRS